MTNETKYVRYYSLGTSSCVSATRVRKGLDNVIFQSIMCIVARGQEVRCLLRGNERWM